MGGKLQNNYFLKQNLGRDITNNSEDKIKSQKVLIPNPKEDKGKKELIRKTTHLKTSRWNKKNQDEIKMVMFSKWLWKNTCLLGPSSSIKGLKVRNLQDSATVLFSFLHSHF